MTSSPLVTILIATKDRPDDLRRTLAELRRQNYPALELIVIDDGSRTPLEPLVRQGWEGAVYIRHPESAGQCKRRSQGFEIARGEYILQLDDDSYPVDSGAIAKAVSVMSGHPDWACLSFYVFNGSVLPEILPPVQAKYHAAFVGCGAMFRRQALAQVGGYRDFFGNEWEEEELGLRLLAAGWVVYFFPGVVIHHHVSVRNRNQKRTWTRQIRNKLWAIFMHMPARRVPLEAGWIAAVGFLDAVRMFRFKAYFQALVQCAAGLGPVLRLRNPMPRLALRRYDAVRFGLAMSEQEYQSPPRWNARVIWHWFTRNWMNRARERSVWDNRPGDTGRSPTVGFAHEYAGETTGERKS
jgi:GT2 family glycosyltransferase